MIDGTNGIVNPMFVEEVTIIVFRPVTLDHSGRISTFLASAAQERSLFLSFHLSSHKDSVIVAICPHLIVFDYIVLATTVGHMQLLDCVYGIGHMAANGRGGVLSSEFPWSQLRIRHLATT